MKLPSVCRAAVLAAAVLTGSAQAQDLTAIYLEHNPVISTVGTFDGSTFQAVNAGVSRFAGFEAFCIEPTVAIPTGVPIGYDYFTLTPAGAADAIARLVGGYYASSQTNVDAAAIQWAIWEVLIDGLTNPSLTSGNAQVQDVAVATAAETYLGNLGSLPAENVVFLTTPIHQDIVTIPEPASLGLLTLSAILFLRRRRN